MRDAVDAETVKGLYNDQRWHDPHCASYLYRKGNNAGDDNRGLRAGNHDGKVVVLAKELDSILVHADHQEHGLQGICDAA